MNLLYCKQKWIVLSVRFIENTWAEAEAILKQFTLRSLRLTPLSTVLFEKILRKYYLLVGTFVAKVTELASFFSANEKASSRLWGRGSSPSSYPHHVRIFTLSFYSSQFPSTFFLSSYDVRTIWVFLKDTDSLPWRKVSESKHNARY